MGSEIQKNKVVFFIYHHSVTSVQILQTCMALFMF